MAHLAIGSRDFSSMRIHQHRTSCYHLNAWLADFVGFIKHTSVVLIAVLTDDLVLLRDERRKIDAQVCGSQSRVAGMGSIVDQAGGFDQVLGGQAAAVDTGASEGTALGHHRRLAQVFSMDGSSEGRRATTQNQQIISIFVLHGYLLTYLNIQICIITEMDLLDQGERKGKHLVEQQLPREICP